MPKKGEGLTTSTWTTVGHEDGRKNQCKHWRVRVIGKKTNKSWKDARGVRRHISGMRSWEGKVMT